MAAKGVTHCDVKNSAFPKGALSEKVTTLDPLSFFFFGSVSLSFVLFFFLLL